MWKKKIIYASTGSGRHSGRTLADAGSPPTPLVVNNRAYAIRVRFPQQYRATPEALNNTVIVSSTGTTATLGSLATIENLPGQTEIL